MMKMDLSANIADIRIDPAIMNASGTLSFPSVLKRLAPYLGAVMLKSVGYEEREGNETPVFVQCSKEAYINAVGLPNPGYRAIAKELEAAAIEKPIGVSIFADAPEKLAEMAAYLNRADFFELNLSCPNTIGDEKIGVEIGKDPELVRQYVSVVRQATNKPVLVKLSPASYIHSRDRIRDIAKAVVDGGADGITAINTIPGGMKIDIYARQPVLSAKYGGVSGKAIKPVGIGCVYAIREAVGNKVPIIGIGGIETAEDIMEYVMAGADAVAIGTAFAGKNTEEIGQYISRLTADLGALVKEFRVDSLHELRSAAHV